MSAADLSVGAIIVTHNSATHLGPCLDAAVRYCGSVVVVDNGSRDDTCAIAANRAGVHLIRNPDNLGFAAATNIGYRFLDREMILLLNPDAVIRSPLQRLSELCRQANVAVASGKLMGANGQVQAGFAVRRFPSPLSMCFEVLGLNRVWPRNPVNRRYRCADVDLDRAQMVEQPAGAFLMVRRDAWTQLGGLDERFHPLWFEDVDFLLRLRRAGYEVWYEPSVEAIHTGGHSLDYLSHKEIVWYWYGNLLQYAAKHFGPVSVRLVAASVIAGSLIRSVLKRISTDPGIDSGYTTVIRFAGRIFRTGGRVGSGRP